jgi:inosine-uridine nucleoside N-ribohydrolase
MRPWLIHFLSAALLLACIINSRVAEAAEPVRLILDTDMGNDIDDALALAMIHALQNRGEVQLLAVTITKDNRWAAPFVDLENTFYGRSEIPIGVVHNGKTPENSNYLQETAQRRDAAGHYLYPHRIESGADAVDAVALLQKILKSQPDHSVTIAQIGFSTNLTRLLKTPGGRELVSQKVKVLSLMAGNFQKKTPEFNVYTDPEAAQYLFAHLPVPVVFSGFEIGLQVPFHYQSILKDFSYTPHHPVADAYKIYLPKGEDRPDWDSTAALYAIRPDRGYFDLSTPGRVSLGPKNTTIFTPDPAGNCRYLILKPEQALRIDAVIESLVSEPPNPSRTTQTGR